LIRAKSYYNGSDTMYKNEFTMPRLMLNDELWSKLGGLMLQHKIYDKPNLCKWVEAMLYRMRVGCPWRPTSRPRHLGSGDQLLTRPNVKRGY